MLVQQRRVTGVGVQGVEGVVGVVGVEGMEGVVGAVGMSLLVRMVRSSTAQTVVPMSIGGWMSAGGMAVEGARGLRGCRMRWGCYLFLFFIFVTQRDCGWYLDEVGVVWMRWVLFVFVETRLLRCVSVSTYGRSLLSL
jgi:hypothetical protein